MKLTAPAPHDPTFLQRTDLVILPRMQNRVPHIPPVPEFTPVPRKHRHDGWTAERQRAFLVFTRVRRRNARPGEHAEP